jgi:spore coat protein A
MTNQPLANRIERNNAQGPEIFEEFTTTMRHKRRRGIDKSRREFIRSTTGIGMGIAVAWKEARGAPVPSAATIIDHRFTAPVINPAAIPKFTDPLPVPGPQWPVLTGPSQIISVRLVNSQILPQNAAGFPKLQTACWGYRASTDYSHTYLGPTVLGVSGKKTTIKFDYNAIDPARHLLRTGNAAVAKAATVVDKHVHGTEMGEPEVRFVAHKHGNTAVDEKSDGYAESWVTPDGKTAATYDSSRPMPSPVAFEPGSEPKNGQIVHNYPNAQGACMAWYHDHALGITRLNVYAGMAAAFLITNEVEASYIARHILPTLGGRFDVPLVIQDRMFYADGSLAYPDQPTTAPNCTPWPGGPSLPPEYYGDCMVVNGKTWPVVDVEPARYRLRFLNGCNARFLDLGMDIATEAFVIIGTEGGFLPSAVSRSRLVLGPAERFDVIFDFARLAGKTVTLTNRGKKPRFPGGDDPRPDVDGVIMQFRVKPSLTGAAEITAALPSKLNPAATPFDKRGQATTTRRVLLFGSTDEFGRERPLLGQVAGSPATGLSAMPMMWSDPITERPKAGTVEIWEIYNTTPDVHPIHIHEIFFSVLDRQPIRFDSKNAMSACKMPLTAFPLTVEGTARPAELQERGYKDTVLAYSGEVTRIVPDFTTAKPGRFVWHCHILEHEDNEMMRPYEVVMP